MATSDETTYPHIVRNPAIVGGEPVIAGTRIPVRSVVVLDRLYHDFAYVCSAFPTASHEGIREALDYYRTHREEIDRLIAANEREAAAPDFDGIDLDEARRRMARRDAASGE